MADAENAPMDTTDGMPRESHKITWHSLCLIFLAGLLILIDFGLDIKLAKGYKVHANKYEVLVKQSEDLKNQSLVHDACRFKAAVEKKYFILTLAFLVIPSVMMTVQSLVGYYRDVQSHVYPKMSVFRWVTLSFFHLLQLGPIWRCAETLILGCRLIKEEKRKELSRRKRRELEEHYNRAHYRLISLKLLESFLEGCPQLVLQTYIRMMAHGTPNAPNDTSCTSLTSSTSLTTTSPITRTPDTDDEKIIAYIKIAFALLSVAKSMMSYYEKKRLDEAHRRVLHGPGIALQFFWYLFTLLSRVAALVTLAVLLDEVAFSFCISVHWLLMVVWIQHDKQKSNLENDDRSNVEANIIYNIAIGGLYVFNFVKEVNRPMKWRYVIYYSIVFCEGLIIMEQLWYNCDPCSLTQRQINILTPIFFVSFALGITFMIIHYKRHPSVVHKANPLRIVVQSDSKSTADCETAGLRENCK